MLNFDSNHQYIDGNIKEKKANKVIKNLVVSGLIIANVFSFSACAKNVPCDISGDHAHYYVNEEDFGRYIISEKSSVSGLERLDNYIPVNDEEDEELLEFINKKDLFRIDENRKAINNVTDDHHDYLEYRYKYYYLLPVPIVHHTRRTTYTTYYYIPRVGYSWTTDNNRSNLTGEERVCHYVYYGYKVRKRDKGKYDFFKSDYELVKSDPVENLDDLPKGYDYIKEKFYDVVNLDDNKKSLDYEDGSEDDKKIISEDEYSKSKQKSK